MADIDWDPLRINFVTDVSESIMRRQEPPNSRHIWTYSAEPIDADVHVVYGLVREIRFPNTGTPRLFVAVEPPEIFEYDTRVLSSYARVLAGTFPYLSSLRNVTVAGGLLNWHAGVDFSVSPAIERLTPDALFEAAKRTRADRVSVITSLKVMTPMQRQRIAFLEYLQRHLAELDVYGRDTRPVADKAEALLPSRYHLALENNSHPYYWTEKLADPILCRCHTFYSGAHPLDPQFDRRSITEIDLANFDSAYRIIVERLSRGLNSDDDAGLDANWEYLTTSANVHSIVERIIRSEPQGFAGNGGQVVPAQRISYTERVRFLRERFRSVAWRRR